MARKKRRSKVTKLRKAIRKRSRAVIAHRSAATDVVAALRTGRYRECPELPDRVLRSIASKAANTRLAIRANYKVWKSWCLSQRPAIRPYPGTAAALAAFLQAHAPPIRVTRGGDFEVLKTGITPNGDQAKSGATLSRYLGTLGRLHIDGGHPDPTKDPEVLAVWRVLRRGLERSTQKQAMGFDAIRQALVALPNTLSGKRDRALLLLAYCLMARRSELVALNVKDFEAHEDGSTTVTFERLKTGVQATNYLSPEVMVVVREWLTAAHIEEGAVFTRLDFAAGKGRARMTGQSVNLVFKRVAKMLNLPELDPGRISGHSARIGATQDLVEDGAPDAAIMRDAGWTAPRMVGMYSRGAQARLGAMAARMERLSGTIIPSNEAPATIGVAPRAPPIAPDN
jgi:integrase/recombinase XerD